jgi:hypothetical protein
MVLGTSKVGEKKEGFASMKNLPQKRMGDSSIKKLKSEKHTYLRVGDKVVHNPHPPRGGGVAIETWSSDLPGGMCFVRVLFQDGKQRIFDNNFDSTCCCYYTGITLLNRIEL